MTLKTKFFEKKYWLINPQEQFARDKMLYDKCIQLNNITAKKTGNKTYIYQQEIMVNRNLLFK